MTAASANGRALGYMAVEIDMQMKTFAVAAGVDLELRRFGYNELDVGVPGATEQKVGFAVDAARDGRRLCRYINGLADRRRAHWRAVYVTAPRSQATQKKANRISHVRP